MECYRHAPTAAVAVCKTCGRAICRTCASDSGFAVTCSTECAKDASDAREIEQRSKRIYGIGSVRRRLPTAVLVWLLFTVVFLGFGLVLSWRRAEIQWFPILFGLAALAVAVMVFRRTKELGLQL